MSHDPNTAENRPARSRSVTFPGPENRGLRTRVLLIAAMAVIIVTTTFASLFTIRRRLESVLTGNLSADLMRSIATFENLQAQRMTALDRENALLADLPEPEGADDNQRRSHHRRRSGRVLEGRWQ